MSKSGNAAQVVTTLSIYMRLTLVASGRFLTMLPARMAQHRSNKAWLRALNIDLSDTAGSIASITVKKRRLGGAVELFRKTSRDVAGGR